LDDGFEKLMLAHECEDVTQTALPFIRHTALLKRSKDEVNWLPSMEMALTKVEKTTPPILTIWYNTWTVIR